MKEKEFERWKKYREIGKVKFTILWSLYWILLLNVGNLFSKMTVGFLFNLVVGILLGVLVGPLRWIAKEKSYRNYLDNIK